MKVVAANCDLLQEAEKFNLGRPTTVYTLHCVFPLLEQKGGYCLTAGRIGKYQPILLDNPNVTLKAVSTLNPVTG